MAKPGGGWKVAIAAVAVVAAVGMFAGGWFAALRLQSPAQREAEALPPAPMPVTVPVELGDLLDRTTAYATVTRAQSVTATLPAQDGLAVVTAIGTGSGLQAASGNVLLWVNGRPVFVLSGGFPAWRDLGETDAGEDVRQLQTALVGAGYQVDVDGVFGYQTATAVRQLYGSVGVEPAVREVDVQVTGPAPPPDPITGQVGEPSQTTVKRKDVLVPAAEVLFLSLLPRQVTALPDVGTVLNGVTGVVSFGQDSPSLKLEVPGTIAVRLDNGGTCFAEHTGSRIDLVVRPLADAAPDAGPAAEPNTVIMAAPAAGSPDSQYVLTLPEAIPFPDDWLDGQAVLITIDLTAPITDALLVPQRAIGIDGIGRAGVMVSQPDGSFTLAPAREIACLAGVCAVESPTLKAGDLVRVDSW